MNDSFETVCRQRDELARWMRVFANDTKLPDHIRFEASASLIAAGFTNAKGVAK